MKNLIIVTAMFLFAVINGCTEDDLCLKGDGNVQEYEIESDAFEHVSIYGPINLRITQDDVREVTVMAEPEIFSHLSYKVRNNELQIGFDDNISCFDTDYGVWVNVSVPNLKSINTSGVNDVVSTGDLDLDELSISTSGTAKVRLSGKVGIQKFRSSGVIRVFNFSLESSETKLDISGTGDYEINATEELDIDVEGTASVSYMGQPTITQKVEGELDLTKAP